MTSQKIAKVIDFKGLIAAPFTPFKPNGEVNVELIPKYVDYLVKNGVKGVFVHGSTGEGLSLTVDERKALTEKWISAGKNKLELIVITVAATCMKETQEMAVHAEKSGASAIASLPPIYFRPQKPAHLVEFLKNIHDAAPNTPLMLYHFPDMVNIPFNLSEVLVPAREAVPTFVGAKYTSLDVRDLQKCHRLPGKPFKLISGYDDAIIHSLDSGVTATIGGTYNFLAPMALRIVEAHEKGDFRKSYELQQKVSEICETIGKYGQVFSALKAVMNLFAPFDVGSPRSPLVPLSQTELSNLKKDLDKLGASTWSSH